jgi:two-component system, cell cycle sensor histidine kinase and response regulator CckA
MNPSPTQHPTAAPASSPAPALLEAIPFPALLVMADGTIGSVNGSLATLCGWSAGSATGRPLAALVPAEVARALLAPEGCRGAAGVIAAADGRPVPVEWISRPAGDNTHLLVCARDCARERELEDYIASNQCFEVAAALSGGLAHDFNNVLAAILGLAEIISLRLPDDSPLQGFTTRIGGSIERAKILVRRFSQFSRKGTGVVEPQPVGMILQELDPLLDAFLPGNMPVELALAEDTPWAMADRHVIEQILLNCANFMRTHLRNDGGKLTLACSTEASGRPLIQLVGQGEGFIGLKIDALFAMDMRPTLTAYESGAGLFVAHKFASESGGSLAIQRRDTRTLVFSLTLPRAD